MAAAQVTTHNYIQGKREVKKVVMEWWRSDFLTRKKLIEGMHKTLKHAGN